ncbi:hypothetical protein PINS_up011610 [Pythium insidiosum]|nr:hypothetical protein PINS_up011610 [Pythium insidiosum]
MAERNAEWMYMDTLRPPVYVCLRRRQTSDDSYAPFEVDGRLDKQEWAHVPWSDAFIDIEGIERKPKEYPLTRVKMMYDDEFLFVGAELMEKQIWGTILQKNATMYHENDFEVFLNPDGSRHNYYELEMNCLNTIWELVLNKPYKDGYSIQNPYNLAHVTTAVYVDGMTNSPLVECNKWSVEVVFRLSELVQFDQQRHRSAQAGDVWRVNFSRVQYELQIVKDDVTNGLRYEKVPDRREDNIVWAPTGVIDIHRPEKWGFLFFSSSDDEKNGLQELNAAMDDFLCEQIAIERVLDTIYYDQRTHFDKHKLYAGSLEELYGSNLERFPHGDLLHQFQLRPPLIQPSHAGEITSDRKRSYLPKLDLEDDGDDDEDDNGQDDGRVDSLNLKALLHPRDGSRPCSEYIATVESARQRWSIRHDAKLWKHM